MKRFTTLVMLALTLTGCGLTMAGHDLLDTVRTTVLWERIKTTAKQKGPELPFNAINVLGLAALKHLVG
ncbi:DUF2513 domain-containing protein [Kluyvera sichuanensis]|uniref:DUF2513 domain-containing protein n=1 Tax=Kluyvera sichuanensis TaxID=2725494 RepID=UPI0039F44A41